MDAAFFCEKTSDLKVDELVIRFQFKLLLFNFNFRYTSDIDLKIDGGVSHDK